MSRPRPCPSVPCPGRPGKQRDLARPPDVCQRRVQGKGNEGFLSPPTIRFTLASNHVFSLII